MPAKNANLQNSTSLMASLMIVASGTGGHVFPGLAIAKALMDKGVPVVWVGTPAGFEAPIVKAAGVPYRAVSVSGLRGKGVMGLISAPFKIGKAVVQSLAIIGAFKPRMVLAMGGYVSGPVGVAAWLKRVRLMIHEQNAIPGLTNQWLAHISATVFSGFPNKLDWHKDFRCVGNPLRQGLLEQAQLQKPPSLEASEKNQTQVVKLRILVVGGSLGARTLNQWVPLAISEIASAQRPEIWHQTGERWLNDTQSEYERLGVAAKVTAFIDVMEEAYNWCDLVICRAGAMTCSEVMAMAIPVIFVPYPYAVDDHQKANADALVAVGAARILIEKESNSQQLQEMILELIQDPKKLDKMRHAVWGQRQLDAVPSIVNYIQDFLSAE